MDVPATGDSDSLGRELAKVIGFSYNEHYTVAATFLSYIGIEYPSPPDDASVLVCCLHALAEAAAINQSKGKPPLVLVWNDVK